MGGVPLEGFLDRPYFPALCVSPALSSLQSSALPSLSPRPLLVSETYSLGLALTRHLQRAACSPFPFAYEQIVQEAKALGLKGPEVGKRHRGNSQNVICHGC